jgi:hypothetical protein
MAAFYSRQRPNKKKLHNVLLFGFLKAAAESGYFVKRDLLAKALYIHPKIHRDPHQLIVMGLFTMRQSNSAQQLSISVKKLKTPSQS